MRAAPPLPGPDTIVVVGMSHDTAPIDLLERMSIPDEQLPKALHDLMGREHVREAAVLSTCNRTEVYAVVSSFHGGAQDLKDFLGEFCHIEPEGFADALFTHHHTAAVRHLFRVAAGLDSMLLGEPEILGQVRRAFRAASEEGALRRLLGAAFRGALTVGKRARTETEIARNPLSVPSAAVQLVKRACEGSTLADKHLAVVGAGAMARLTAQTLMKSGATDLVIVNRSEPRGRELARRFEGRFRPLRSLADVLSTADVVVFATTSPQALIDRPTVEAALERRRGRDQLIIVDVALPRDVDPAVGRIPAVVLHDLTDLRTVVDANFGRRLKEVPGVEAIVAEEVRRFGEWERSSRLAPVLSALVAKGEAIREQELARMRGHSVSLPPEQWEAVERLTARIVSKLLHVPLTRVKQLQQSEHGPTYLESLRDLFDLNEGDAPA